MASVTLENIGKRFGTKPVLSGLSLTVRDGECFTLLGPSGCGKTVLLRLIAGFDAPDAGRVLIDDTVVSDAADGDMIPPDRRGLGVVFQDYAVWPHMTVFDNIAYPLKLARIPRGEANRRVLETIDMVNLSGLKDRLPSQLSGGQQQRVALARALTAKPSILLLDEPLCNLDANLREEMRFEIKDLQRQLGITVFYVTHDQEVALAISDRLAVMDETGAVRQIGPPEEVYERPADSFVFRFLGTANFLAARRDGDACRLEREDQLMPCPPPPGLGSDLVAGFRPSDVILSRQGQGLSGVVKRASFLGAVTDYLIEVGQDHVRTQLETHQALVRDLLFQEGEPCVFGLRNVHWFDRAAFEEGR